MYKYCVVCGAQVDEWENTCPHCGKDIFFGSIMDDASPIGDFVIQGGELVKYVGKADKVVIPSVVKSIGYRAFYLSNIKSVVIPDGVTSIGIEAFYLCSSLQEVRIAGSVQKILPSAFKYCHSLCGLTLGEGIEEIGAGAFEGCYCLHQLTIPNSVTTIDSAAFSHCKNLLTATIGKSVKIANNVFGFCYKLIEIRNLSELQNVAPFCVKNVYTQPNESKLKMSDDGYVFFLGEDSTILVDYAYDFETDIVLPNNFEGNSYKIGPYAFSGHSNIAKVTLPNTVTEMGTNVFENCSTLAEVILPEGLKSIPSETFRGCEKLKKVVLGKIESIQQNAFLDCSVLTDIALPKTLKQIDGGVFSGCSGLKQIIIPESVEIIANSVFARCKNLIIKCRIRKCPRGWDKKWNPEKCKVQWKCSE